MWTERGWTGHGKWVECDYRVGCGSRVEYNGVESDYGVECDQWAKGIEGDQWVECDQWARCAEVGEYCDGWVGNDDNGLEGSHGD